MMATRLRQLHVRRTDGTSSIVRTEPDTLEGRAAIDREAFERLLQATVRECWTTVGTRVGVR